MIMIAFITVKSGLVPLIEGLCAQISYFRFEIIGGLRSHLVLFFVERKNMLRCWVFLERTRILSVIQFTTYFIDFFVVEKKRFVSCFVNVILKRQTCSQFSSRAAESKRRAIGNYFSERICYMFLISKKFKAMAKSEKKRLLT